MSVLVKGMEMPKFGEQFEVKIDANGNFFLYRVGSEDDIFYISELPKHGDLIDRDAVIDKVALDYTAAERNGKLIYAAVEVKQGFCDLLADLPTVLEAED